MALAPLGLLSHRLGNDQEAQEYSQQALGVPYDREDHFLWQFWFSPLFLTDTLACLGHALADLGELDRAAEVYHRALDAVRELHAPFAIEPMAGLAHVALAEGDPAGALVLVGEVLPLLEAHSVLLALLDPLRAHLSCYRVLQANGDLRAGGLLVAAHSLLQERARTIEDEALRRSYLEDVPSHRQIVAEYTGRSVDAS
jgi:tetratricopeptide (TPR) repeat protein